MHRAVLALLLVGCITAKFVQTDPRFRSAPRRTLPPAYLDRLPEQPYRSVGIIEVQGPAGDFDLGKVVKAAREKAAKLGCDLVVDRAIHKVTSAIERAGPLVAQYPYVYTPPPTATPQPIYVANAAPPGRREFICGVYVRP